MSTGCDGNEPATAANPVALDHAQRILFLGDSITWDGRYVAAFESWLLTRTRAPGRTVLNAGLPSETVSGLSEAGHANGDFERPNLHERLDRVLEHVKPDLVFACYGMNCGIYEPFDEGRFARYRDGITKLQGAATKAGAQIVFITPAFYDNASESNRQASYDEVLTRYSEWLVSRREIGWHVIDVHGPMQREVARRRAITPDFTFSPDGIHPDDAGHWFMAQQLIEYFGDARASHSATQDEVPGLALGTYAIVRERMEIVRDGLLTATGHKHPTIPAGLPEEQVQAKVEEFDAKLKALYSTS
ncbi:MAG: SGNH/GDSL hydrolase family protein [Candidatus Hydrogenedentes bacterium]|nr:SGNH/GDSL hydrolase family protein [Candidatus Hydrogenedentota bacterium]